MARRSPVDERPFRPLDTAVLNSVVKHDRAAAVAGAGNRPLVYTAAAETARTVVEASPIVSARPPAGAASAIPIGQRLDQEKRILFTRAETQAIDRLVNNLAGRLNAQVKVSHIIRALSTLLLHAEGELDKRATERGPLARPSNGDFAALQRFEREIATLVCHALRDAGPPPAAP